MSHFSFVLNVTENTISSTSTKKSFLKDILKVNFVKMSCINNAVCYVAVALSTNGFKNNSNQMK